MEFESIAKLKQTFNVENLHKFTKLICMYNSSSIISGIWSVKKKSQTFWFENVALRQPALHLPGNLITVFKIITKCMQVSSHNRFILSHIKHMSVQLVTPGAFGNLAKHDQIYV